MIKLAVFDIDNTLAKLDKPISQNVVKKLRKLQDVGVKIALISGKPAFYIDGFARGAGLGDILIAGENGGVVFDPSTLEVKYLKKKLTSLDIIEKSVKREFSTKIWLQPNEVILTIFPRESVEVNNIEKFVKRVIKENRLDDVHVLTHVDAVDVVPKGLDKGLAIKYFCKLLEIPLEHVAAVGDSESDISMFKLSGFSIAVGGENKKVKFKASTAARNIISAIEALMKMKKGNKWSG